MSRMGYRLTRRASQENHHLEITGGEQRTRAGAGKRGATGGIGLVAKETYGRVLTETICLWFDSDRNVHV